MALAEAMFACLPGADSEAAMLALAEIGDNGDSPQLRWLLHQATGDRSHLEQAKSLLDEQLAKVPTSITKPCARTSASTARSLRRGESIGPKSSRCDKPCAE